MPRGNILFWLTSGVLAIADQGLFAGSNFLLNVILARWLRPVEYGAFAVAYSVYALLAALHTAVVIEPMLVFGSGRYRQRLAEYFGILLRAHFAVMVPISFIILLVSIPIGIGWSTEVGHALASLAVAAPVILVLWIPRRAFFIELQPGWAALGGFLYLITLVVTLFVLRIGSLLSVSTAFLVMSLSAGAVAFVLTLRIHPKWVSGSPEMGLAKVAIAHWRYGRWSMGAAVVAWFPLYIYFVLLPVWSGFEQAAVFRALLNLMLPILLALAALGSLLTPTLVRNLRGGGHAAMSRTMLLAFAVFLSCAAVFCVAVWVFKGTLFRFLYGGKYEELGFGPLLLLLFACLTSCLNAVLAPGLMALERPDGNFWSYLAASVTTITIGLPLVGIRGVEGAAEGYLVSCFVAAVFLFFFYRRARFGQTRVPVRAENRAF